ncbi:hypothetical protein QUB56_18650 [Microcoleus sp. AR_TQ3_B6]|uniref:hypothetical protein n=1 Tax=Microcoleus sp. AR_TQ3_B6 TaxID=3055284 RepID=UPI002FD361CA
MQLTVAVFVVEQARKAYDRTLVLCEYARAKLSPPKGESRRPISLNFCGSVAERKTQYARLRKLYLQPSISDRDGIAISLWAAQMPAHAAENLCV